MNKKDILKKFKKHLDEHCTINTKLREKRVLILDGVETEVDIPLLYSIGVLGYNLIKEIDFLEESNKRDLESFPIDKGYTWGFPSDWFFSWTSITSKKPSQNAFLIEVTNANNEYGRPMVSKVKVPSLWYMLASYPHISLDMIEEMEPMYLKMIKLNKNISQEVKEYLNKL
jgi:hypothetical protein